MSYAMSGFGTVVTPTPSCGPNEGYNTRAQKCLCKPGFEDVGGTCKPVNTKAPCQWTGQQRSPVDLQCSCPPGMAPDPSAEGTGCIAIRWFPSCIDANGAKVPNCLFGFPMKETLAAAGIGLLIGAMGVYAFSR